jgi:hypothetical protein
VALVSYNGGETNSEIIAAQEQVIADDLNVFTGAATDTLVGLPYRTGVHFLADGLTAHAELWFDCLNAAFPEFKVTAFSCRGAGASLSFTGFRGERYAVEMSECLNAVDWQTVTNIDSLTESPFFVDVASTNNVAFYRVRLVL